jgi:hypothetical protein
MQDTAFLYVDCSIPEGMTIAEYRRVRYKPEPPRHRLRRWLTPRPITVTA